MEVKLPAFSENYFKETDRQNDPPTDARRGGRTESLSLAYLLGSVKTDIRI